MKIARTVSCLLAAAGFAASSLAFAQGQTETPAAAPDVAPEAAPEGDPAPARSVLWPDFQVGQHLVLMMSYLDTKKSDKPVIATVTIDVIDKIDDTFIIRWKSSDARIPKDFRPMAMAPFLTIWDGLTGPTLEILVQEDVGVLGLRNWEAARDEALAESRAAMLKVRESDGTPTAPEKVDAILASFTQAALPNRDAVDVTLLKNVRVYFDGSYHSVAPGETSTEDLEIAWPFGGDENLALPMSRTTTLTTIATDPAPIYELLINLKPDDARFKELMKAFTDKMADNLKSAQLDRLANSTIEYKVRWRLDTAKGWPTRVSSTTRLQSGVDVTTQTVTYALIDGPTMKAAELKPDAAPAQPEAAQPDAAQPNPAHSDAPANPK